MDVLEGRRGLVRKGKREGSPFSLEEERSVVIFGGSFLREKRGMKGGGDETGRGGGGKGSPEPVL